MGAGGPVVVAVALGLVGQHARGVARGDEVGPRLHVLEHGPEREDGDGALAALGLDRDVALPDHPAVVADLTLIAVLALRRRVGGGDGLAHQVAIRHAPDLDMQARDIDGVDADAVRLLARQDHALAVEADIGRLVGAGEVHRHVVDQGFAGLGGQALEQGELMAGEPQARHAELVVVHHGRDRVAEVGADQHEVGIGFPRVERPGQAHARYRIGARGVDPGGPDGEAVRFGHAGARRIGGAGLAEEGPGEAGRGAGGMGRSRQHAGRQEAAAESQRQSGASQGRRLLLEPAKHEPTPGIDARNACSPAFGFRQSRDAIQRKAR